MGLSLGQTGGRPKANRTKSLCLCAFFLPDSCNFRMTEKGGWVLGGSLHDGFDGFGGSGEHLALLLLVLQNTVPRGSRDGFGGFGGCGGFGRDGYPLKPNPPFPSS